MSEGITAASDGEPIGLLVDRDASRNRLTVFFRLILVIPQAVVVSILLAAGLLVVIPAWFAALVLGRSPAPLREFLGDVVAWNTRVQCYFLLVTDAYPPWSGRAVGHPVDVRLPPPGHLNRLAVIGRIVLAVPAYVVGAVITLGLYPFVFFAWFAGVFAGRIPRAVTDAVATAVRYQARLLGYVWLVTPTYPWGPLGDGVDQAGPSPYGYGPPPVAGYPPSTGYGSGYPPPPPGYGYPPPPPASPVPPLAGGAYPPMPTPPSPAPDPGRYSGRVSNGARAILIVAVVLGGLAQLGNVIGTATGHGGTFTASLQSFELARAGARFDTAIEDASCPAGGAACTNAVAARLLNASGGLERYTHGGRAGTQRGRLGSDLATFETEVRRAARAGDLTNSSGEVVDTSLLEQQTAVDDDVTSLERALG